MLKDMPRPSKTKKTFARRIRRRMARPLLLLMLMGVVWSGSVYAGDAAFDYEQLVARAHSLAGKPYQPPASVPQRFADLDYSRWNAIRFKRSAALWQDARFHVQFTPAGYMYRHPVRIHVVSGGQVHRIEFSPDLYRVKDKMLPHGLPSDLGFAGFRLTYPLNQADKQDEVLSFLGASYFRAVPKGGWFGLSARGIAIDTVAQSNEQFPRFTDFWLVKPAADAQRMTVYALLDGKSVTGAYRFRIKPGGPTVVDVRATLFLRHPVEQLGLAPLTSMYFYGVGGHKPDNQSVPAIHDSNGLLVHRGDGQWTWRPLENPDKVRTTSFHAKHLHGFGLLQRDRRTSDFLDPEQHYAERPSLWIQPRGNWKPGQVTLVELPTDNSYMDNIVAFWSPDEQPDPGQPLQLRYRMSWRTRSVPSNVGRVASTLVGGNQATRAAKYVIDYVGGKLDDLEKNTPPKGRVVTHPETSITENRVEPNPYTGGWRQVIQVMPKEGQPVHVRAGLGQKENPLTETWDYTVAPKRVHPAGSDP